MKRKKPKKKYGNVEAIEGMLKKEDNVKLANRLNAIRLRQLGYSAEEIAKICNVTRRSVQNWVKNWNERGKEGLKSKSGGTESRVTDSIRAEIEEIIEIDKEINGKKVTGKLICGYLKKTTP